jgi:DNA polymerase-1
VYRVFDEEVENNAENKRFASPFCDKNYIVARGWKDQGDTACSYEYFPAPHKNYMHIPDKITMLVGLNIKFDLLYEWEGESLKAFFKRGGKIWCCQYAEYLLNGQDQASHMVSMDQIITKYGGRKKLDQVKDLWEAGWKTSEIDKDMLIDYLVGTEAEGRNSGDVGNTELIFLAQIEKAKQLGMLPMIMARMDGLLCTTEMEYNGLKIDVKAALELAAALEDEAEAIQARMTDYIPKDLPPELEFNWNSPVHSSCIIFGGTAKYQKQAPYIDPETGVYARKKAEESWPLFNGEPADPKNCTIRDSGLYQHSMSFALQDVYVSGKNKGMGKFKKVRVQGEIKTKYQDFFYHFRGYTTPNSDWAGDRVDGKGEPLYSVASDIIEELGSRNIPFLKDLARLKKIEKDLGTYYIKHDGKEPKGMLTCVNTRTHIVHHRLNHTSTVTSRLSSSDPNLQNIPRGDTSDVKKMFISRFKNGTMLEADYSQLEVVVQGLLTNDTNLIRDLIARVDFHCKRVSAWKGCTYDEAKLWCKDETHPNYPVWKVYRTNAKVFSFQRAYGAGAAKISTYTGMPIEDVKALIEAEDLLYPGVLKFNSAVEAKVKASAVPVKVWNGVSQTSYLRGQWQAPTGTLYTFRSHEALEWQQKKGITESFMPTELKNYPIQGTGGEIVQIILGKLWRHFVQNNNYNGSALLCNTVHDCIWIDVDLDAGILDELAKNVKSIMESVPETLKALYGMACPVPFPVELEIGKNLFDKQVIHV